MSDFAVISGRQTTGAAGRTRDWITVRTDGRKRQAWAETQAKTLLREGESLSGMVKNHPIYTFCVRQPSVDRH